MSNKVKLWNHNKNKMKEIGWTGHALFSSLSYINKRDSKDLFILEGFFDFASLLNYEDNILALNSKNVASDFHLRLESQIKEFGSIERIFLLADRDVYSEDLKKRSNLIFNLKEFSNRYGYEFYIIATMDLDNYDDYAPKDFNDIVKYYQGDFEAIEEEWIFLKEKALSRDLDAFIKEWSQSSLGSNTNNEVTLLDENLFDSFYSKYKIITVSGGKKSSDRDDYYFVYSNGKKMAKLFSDTGDKVNPQVKNIIGLEFLSNFSFENSGRNFTIGLIQALV